MTDTVTPTGPNPMFVTPAPVPPLTSTPSTNPPVVKDQPHVAKVNHLGEISELVRNLVGQSPSGVETIVAKLNDHIGALQDPKAYDARIAEHKKAHDEAQAAAVKAKAKAEAEAARVKDRDGYNARLNADDARIRKP
jgi:hypothetical protein